MSRGQKHHGPCPLCGRVTRAHSRLVVADVEPGARASCSTTFTCDTHVTICRAKSERITTHYLGYVLSSLQTHFENMAVGSTGQSELSRNAIARTPVLLPPMTIQIKFSNAVRPLLQEKRLLREQCIVLKATRDALLPRLISGKLTVDSLDIRFPPGMAVID